MPKPRRLKLAHLERIGVQMSNDLLEVLDIEGDHLFLNSRIDTDAPQYLSEDERGRTLDVLRVAANLRPTRANVYGLAAIEADNTSHEALRRLVARRWPEHVFVGEEGSEEDWNAWQALAAGGHFWNVDSLDGSMLYDSMTFGYGATAALYQRMPDGTDELLLTVTVNSSNYALIYIAPYDAVYGARAPRGRGTITHSRLERVTGDRLHRTAREGVVACVAAQGKHRSLVAPLFASGGGWGLVDAEGDELDLTVPTLGGAPAATGLVVGRLTALVVPERQTLHDAAPLIGLAAVGLAVVNEFGIAVPYAELKARFNAVARPESGDDEYHPVPRMVFARDLKFAQLLARRVYRRDDEGGPNERPGKWRIVVEPEPVNPGNADKVRRLHLA